MSVYLNSINDDYQVECSLCGSVEAYHNPVLADRAYESHLFVCHPSTDEIPGDQLGTKALIVVAMALSTGAAIGVSAHLIVGWLS